MKPESRLHRKDVPQYTVALVEDQREIREHWASLLKTFAEFNCVRTCASAEEALKVLPALNPRIVLMDIFLPQMSGIECTAHLKAKLPDTQILILTASDDEEMVFPALEAGADGYLLKQSTPAGLRAALRDVLQGGLPMTSGIARRVAAHFRARGRKRNEVSLLSTRETEILEMLAMGYSDKEIASKLSLSAQTINSYLKNVYQKMHVHSRTEAVAKYMSANS
jgi:DNA-binding NarL/FixJ family response regulator